MSLNWNFQRSGRFKPKALHGGGGGGGKGYFLKQHIDPNLNLMNSAVLIRPGLTSSANQHYINSLSTFNPTCKSWNVTSSFTFPISIS